MSSAAIPDRVRWALRVLDVISDDEILELGTGPGLAAGLVCERLSGRGRLVGIDRSATAVERASRRNADHVAAGRASFLHMPLSEYHPRKSFDKAFAINVNVFWTAPDGPELGVVARLLRPGGVLHLVFDSPPGSGKAISIERVVTAAMVANGFTPSPESSASVLAIAGRLPPHAVVTVE